MKPLFVNGMFNREGKRIRAQYIKSLFNNGKEYFLWICAGKNEKDYPRAENDTHYVNIQAGEYLVPCGYTMFDLEQRSAYELLNKKWYGDFENRNRFFDDLREGKSREESNLLVKEQLDKEKEFISNYSNDEEAQVIFLETIIDLFIERYIEARDNGGKFADFSGAAFLGELDQCDKISQVLKEERKEADKIKRAERETERKREEEKAINAELKAIEVIKNTLKNGGVIKEGDLLVKIADKYGIKIPLRTRGWMLNTLAECTVSENGGISYRYWKRKGGTGSQKFYAIMFDLQKAVKEVA